MSLFPIRIKSNDQTLHAQDDFLIKEMNIIIKKKNDKMFLNLNILYFGCMHIFPTCWRINVTIADKKL